MKLSNLTQRIITCILGIPLLICIIFLLPGHNYIVFAVFTMLITLLASLEMSKMLFSEYKFQAFLSWTMLLSCYLKKDVYLVLLILLLLDFVFEIKAGEKDSFKESVENVSKNVLITIYPAFFMVYQIKLIMLENINSFIILLFLLSVFSNDIFAYVFGRLFGKNNMGLFKVSPKKSLAGFIGGFISCNVICLVYTLIFKEYLPSLSIIQSILLFSLMSILSDIGDLFESVIKRSKDVKDSGNIVPGRGGILDCIDSISLCIPVFYTIICRV